MPRETIAIESETAPATLTQGGPAMSTPDRAAKFVAERFDKYYAAIDDAREIGLTTQTHAWQENYRTQMDAHTRRTREEAYIIETTAKYIADHDSDEAHEKKIKDALKMLIEERVAHEAWIDRTVRPYENAVERCNDLLETAKREAFRIDESNPLMYSGFGAAVVQLLNAWPEAKWFEKTGIVEVVELTPESAINLNA